MSPENEAMYAELLAESRWAARRQGWCPECHYKGGHAVGCPADEDVEEEGNEEAICSSCDGNGRHFSRATGTFGGRCEACNGRGVRGGHKE